MQSRGPWLFTIPPNPSFICPLCSNVMAEPRQTQCQHTFCLVCIEKELQKRAECPSCQTPIEFEKLSKPAFILLSLIYDQTTFCDQSSNGCQWSSPWRDLNKHLSNCMFVAEPCMFGCGEDVLKKDSDFHKFQKCRSRFKSCKHCFEEVHKSQTKEHILVCTEFPIACDCCIRIPKKSLPLHKKSTCSLAVVPCSFGEVGCAYISARKNHIVHLLDNIDDHAKMLEISVNKMNDAKVRLAQKEQELEQTRMKLSHQEAILEHKQKQVESLESRVNKFQDQCNQLQTELSDREQSLEDARSMIEVRSVECEELSKNSTGLQSRTDTLERQLVEEKKTSKADYQAKLTITAIVFSILGCLVSGVYWSLRS
eukprot:TRINITY_DN1904_c0_g1_i2.p1 TRINITY_DN1904_c0_g1~~TRINITY_DN1904_c0_g1_i2.p1  ORF type:complete len:368 (-),score=26.01 TRINITY_DN1904_c0_g1_i2:133-1236(-)